MSGHRILMIVSGGIAAYKSLELVRILAGRGIAVRAILTEGGSHFVTALSLEALTGDRVYTDLWSSTDEAGMGHIELSRSADLIVVAPASADILARMAAGIASDLATTTLLATDKAVLVAPAMNVRMWEHQATRDNIRILRSRGIHMIGPEEGPMACGEFGYGRLAEPVEIAASIDALLVPDRSLAGLTAIVTSGPTEEPIDPVRFLGNRSSGRQGNAVALALARAGARVTLVSGPTALPDPFGIDVIRVRTACEMMDACHAALPADIAVCAAAVADWRVASPSPGKLKKSDGAPRLQLTENPDILAILASHGDRPALVIGFAAETGDPVEEASAKRIRKGCDWILANDVGADGRVFGDSHNQVHWITPSQHEEWPFESKDAVAARLVRKIAAHFENRTY